MESAKKAAGMVQLIKDASNEPSTAIAQIHQGISQASQAVQTSSATAEECVASSEEFSGQAETLMRLVKRFKLKTARPA